MFNALDAEMPQEVSMRLDYCLDCSIAEALIIELDPCVTIGQTSDAGPI